MKNYRKFDPTTAKHGDQLLMKNSFMELTDLTFIAMSINDSGRDRSVICENRDGIRYANISGLFIKPLAMVEGKPVYKGDSLYHKNSKKFGRVDGVGSDSSYVKQTIDGDSISLDSKISNLSWEKPKVKKTGWINIYNAKNCATGANQQPNEVSKHPFKTEQEADEGKIHDRIACVQIEWEE